MKESKKTNKEKELSMEDKFFNEYIRLEGELDREIYDFYKNIFLAITVGYIGGSTAWSGDEAFDRWIDILYGDEDEAVRIFQSIDNVAAYT